MGEVKKQHYIPQSILGIFVESDSHISELLVDESKIIPRTNISNAMCERYAYEHSLLEVNALEKTFSKIEGQTKMKVNKIKELISANKDSDGDFQLIKGAVEDCIKEFIIFYYRSGALLYELSSGEKKREDRILNLLKKILNSDYIEALASTITDCYNFAIIEAFDSFLLSDQYVSTVSLKVKSQFFDHSNRHIGLKNMLICIPITHKYYAVYYNSDEEIFLKSNQINILSAEETELINKAIINNSYKKCAAINSEILDLYKDSYRFRSTTTVYAGSEGGHSFGAVKKKEVFLYDRDREVFEMIGSPPASNYFKCKVNDKCPCESGKKFKRCHMFKAEELKEIYDLMAKQQAGQLNWDPYRISDKHYVEQPIISWGSYSKK